MKFYQFSIFWQHATATSPSPRKLHHTDIRQKYRYKTVDRDRLLTHYLPVFEKVQFINTDSCTARTFLQHRAQSGSSFSSKLCNS
ncbi:hypothetical protein [Microcoleus sp. herbarium12]|uniref:hypothetical protein n=1 Tax=Microcoleus sp. herbarium12 TaxID=3055437 RepID=UPI002FD69F7F